MYSPRRGTVRVKQLETLYPVVEFKVKGEAQVESEVQVKHSTRPGKLSYKGANPEWYQ